MARGGQPEPSAANRRAVASYFFLLFLPFLSLSFLPFFAMSTPSVARIPCVTTCVAVTGQTIAG